MAIRIEQAKEISDSYERTRQANIIGQVYQKISEVCLVGKREINIWFEGRSRVSFDSMNWHFLDVQRVVDDLKSNGFKPMLFNHDIDSTGHYKVQW